jgi:diguanylate cyclase (GGDEF)-like protein
MTQREEIVGRTIFDVFPDNPEDLNATGVANLSASLQRVLATGARDKMPIQKYDIPSPGSDRFEPRYWAPENRPVMGDDGRVAFILHCVRNVTDRVMQAARVENLGRDLEIVRHAALHDALTALPNRALAVDRLEMALERRKREGTNVAVLMIDLDRFKVINDSLGHHIGDELLAVLAPRLAAAVRSNDTIARLGGDEFGVICDAPAHPQDVVGVAERLLASLSEPVLLSTGRHHVGASIGIALAGGVNDTAGSLLRDADAAMYVAKRRGGRRYEIFDETIRQQSVDRMRTEEDLRMATAKGELRVHYQPIIDLRSGWPIGTEALLRWQHPERGLLPPDDFIPIAEETGLIHELGHWVLENAASQAGEWHKRYGAPLSVAVNVSATQLLDDSFADLVIDVAASAGVQPAMLQLEITETAMIEDTEVSVSGISALRKQGLNLVLDDFGTGYASLSHLSRVIPDAIKIDRSFTDGVGRDHARSVIVGGVISLARDLGVTVIAEGVETSAQYQHLRRLGCHRGQGHYWSRAQPAETATLLLDQMLGNSKA